MPIDERRRAAIAAAIAAYDRATPRACLPRRAARLLIIMFPAENVCRRSVGSLAAEGFERAAARQLLRALIDAGFVSKDPGRPGALGIYRLHLTPVRR
jgi:hypothetical protein